MSPDTSASAAPDATPAAKTSPMRESHSHQLAQLGALVIFCLVGAAAYAYFDVRELQIFVPEIIANEDVVQIILTTCLLWIAYLIHIIPLSGWGRAERFRHLFLIVPTAAFMLALLLHGDKDVAIFGMALVALYLALEHFASLERQAGAIDVQTSRMEIVSEQLQVQALALAGQTSVMNGVSTKLEIQVGNLENALGTQEAQTRIFDAYSNLPANAALRGIYAVHRYFDIDRQWWNRLPSSDPEPAWGHYETIKSGTLYSALDNSRPTRVLFVSSMPNGFGNQLDKAEQFGKFIGLLWYHITLSRLAEMHKCAAYEIRIAECTNWIHVVGDTVFQLIGKPPAVILARELSFNLRDSDKEKMRSKLASWAIDDITTVAGRGHDAKEFLCAAILRAGLRHKWKYNDLIDGDADALLDTMGFSAWYAACADGRGEYAACPADFSEDNAKTCCKQILSAFFRQCSPPSIEPRTRKSDLTRELL